MCFLVVAGVRRRRRRSEIRCCWGRDKMGISKKGMGKGGRESGGGRRRLKEKRGSHHNSAVLTA